MMCPAAALETALGDHLVFCLPGTMPSASTFCGFQLRRPETNTTDILRAAKFLFWGRGLDYFLAIAIPLRTYGAFRL